MGLALAGAALGLDADDGALQVELGASGRDGRAGAIQRDLVIGAAI